MVEPDPDAIVVDSGFGGPVSACRLAAVSRFGRLFAGGLWDVYLRRVLPTAPF